jgi:very-short-patch-repair endonuclease/ABC-type branched-subunit amino acid transport system ATPase component
MSDADRIQQLLSQSPGLKAQQIANELGIEKPRVVTTLHGLLGTAAVQDSSYRWWPKVREPRSSNGNAASAGNQPRTFLANLCRYYLECLARESGSGISLPAAETAGYVVLDRLPFAAQADEPWGSERAIRKIVQKTRRERGQLTLYAGYPVRLRTLQMRNAEEPRIEPVLLYPIEDAPDERAFPLRPSSGIPLFNLDVLKTLPSVDSGNVIDEAIHLSEELGLADAEDDLPQWDEIILRLERCRPDWGWREPLNPYELSSGAPLAELGKPGIYNRAVLFAGTRSPFTYGLEIELRKLMQLDEDAVRNTALGAWLSGQSLETAPPEDRPILEVVPHNTEQRQAVVQGLSAPLTVVTGPPGTGKSQVVASLLANMAWQGGSVLFSSKNNHAVDVVETRVNGLGPYPLLLRLGKEEHHVKVAQNLAAGLAENVSPDAAARYAWLNRAHEEDRARFAAVQHEIAAAVSLRNTVDELERAAEPARSLFGERRFAEILSADLPAMRRRMLALAAAIAAARESAAPAMVRLLRDPGKGRRFDRIAEAAAEAAADAARLGLALPEGAPAEATLDRWEDFRLALAGRLEWAERVRAYGQGLDRLRASKPLDRLACDLTRIAEESAHNSLDLWQCWLRQWPSRWNPERRKLLSEYVSLLQMIASGDRYDEGAGRRVFRRYYSLFPKVSKILPCWAVTSLSARGRLPFEAGCFDLVVIDEASQCDIASALPLLYRARRAVIIGDPLQLKHVSTVAPQEDRLLLAAHGLAEGHAAWAYSVNSLFDLARSLCRHEDIVNLRDHHRSHRDIISFSNLHFYRGALRIATDHESLHRPQTEGPAVRWVEMRGKVVRPSAGGAVNVAEAERVVAEVRKLVLARGYDGAIGVVTPFRAHANRIRTLVHQDHELSERLASMQFVVDTVHGFQGDERDVIFFSPVVSMGVGESTLRFLKSHGNLFNVAITRARSELVVVGDRQAALDSGVDYLARFAEYTRSLGAHETRVTAARDAGPEYPPVAHPELVSDWERVFYRALHAAGLRPVPQYEEAPYTLDFALFDGERRLDIEVDGENYHRNWDGELCRRDQIRSRRLSDLGWEIERFWVYEIRDDLEGSVRRVQAWRSGLGPTSHSLAEP